MELFFIYKTSRLLCSSSWPSLPSMALRRPRPPRSEASTVDWATDTPATVATTVDSVDTEDWAMVDTTLLDTTVDTQVIDRSLSHVLYLSPSYIPKTLLTDSWWCRIPRRTRILQRRSARIPIRRTGLPRIPLSGNDEDDDDELLCETRLFLSNPPKRCVYTMRRRLSNTLQHLPFVGTNACVK